MQTSVRVSLLRVEIKNLLRKFLGAENENDCSGGKSEFENGNESSHNKIESQDRLRMRREVSLRVSISSSR